MVKIDPKKVPLIKRDEYGDGYWLDFLGATRWFSNFDKANKVVERIRELRSSGVQIKKSSDYGYYVDGKWTSDIDKI